MTVNTHDYDNAKHLTAMSLTNMIETTDQLTHLSLPERTALVEEVARVVPAGNVPSMVAARLANLPGRTVPIQETRRNLNLLMQGMQTFMDKAVFNTFFVGPATILSAYQMLLKLAGKDIEASFPEGTWQFYVEFGLREDSGRHTCETVGFQRILEREQIDLSAADELACWLMACAWLLNHYDELLANEWTEHIRLQHISSMLADSSVIRRWQKSRPYAVPPGSDVGFAEYRRASFEAFCSGILADANPRVRKRIEDSWNDKQAVEQRARDLAAYQRQMSILAALQPTEHSDQRVSLSRDYLSIAVISAGRYYVIDLAKLNSIDQARILAAAILRNKSDLPPANLDKILATVHRREQTALRKQLPEYTKTELERLRHAPIVLNWDAAPSDQPLMDIRSGRRGVGDHALTVFRASESTVFDLSHIFFDGPWGMAVAEILTGLSSAFARQLGTVPKITEYPAVTCLDLEAPSGLAAAARKSRLSFEVSAETTLVDLNLIQLVRDNLRRRNGKLLLTVNDVLILYRAIFGQIYQPSTSLVQALQQLSASEDGKQSTAGMLALQILDENSQMNPSLLIPMDANCVNPRERIYPTTFRSPFSNLLMQHRNALAAWETLEAANMLSRPLASRTFVETRRNYLSTLQAFGQVLSRYKDVSLKGESISTASIKLLAGLPASVQRMLDSLPGTFDVVNDIVKGQEVFSNVGQVSPTSSLRRFNTAKDDNEKKVLAWGIMTDSSGVMHVSLRDARPHVAALFAAKRQALAQQVVQEYVDAYALTLNIFLEELLRITRSRKRDE